MLARSVLLGAALVLAPVAANAQDATQISKVASGASACVGCNLFQADFAYQELSGRNLSGARLRQADLTVATLDRANLTNTNLSVANAFGARLQSANLKGANLDDAVFVGAWLGGADMSGVSMRGANFSGAYLATTKNLKQSQLSTACGDATTELPAGLSIPNCD
ncbi:MAG: pentapeptide repeat-containing protein [Pseudomonadota bacterium]